MGWQTVAVPILLAGNTIINPTGEFIYSSTPALGNLQASLVPGASTVTDPEGNTAQPGITVYASASDYAQLLSGVLNFVASASQFSPGIVGSFAVAGQCGISSGEASNTDSAANMIALSAQASGSGQSTVSLQATVTQVTGSLTVNGSSDTGNSGLPDGTIHGTSGGASAGTAHTHGPGSFAVGNGNHNHVL